MGEGWSGWETSACRTALGCCNCVSTLPETPFLSTLEVDNAKPQGLLLEIFSCAHFVPNSHVGLPAEVCGSLDSPQVLLERAAVCQERLLAICYGDGQKRAGDHDRF